MATYASWTSYTGGWGQNFACSAAQTFKSSNPFQLTQIDLRLKKLNDLVAEPVDLFLYAVDVNHKPTGSSLLTIGQITNAMLTTSYAWVSFTGLNYICEANVEYAIVGITTTDVCATTGSEEYVEIYWSGRAGYSSGIGWYIWCYEVPPWTCGTSWENSGYDFNFRAIGNSPYPSAPINPTPANGATAVDFSAKTLSWENGGNTTSYDVYIGQASEDLMTIDWTLVSASQAGTSYVVQDDEFPIIRSDGAFYWRIDAKNAYGTTTGSQWHFYPLPPKPINPAPVDEETKVDKKTSELVWEEGVGGSPTATFNIYFGTESGSLTEIYTERDVLTPTWTSPMVVLEINDYNPASNSGYRSPQADDELTCGDTTYYIYDVKRGDLVNVQYEAKLYAFRVGAPCNAGDELTNGVSPDIENPQAVKVTLNNSWHFHGEVESAYYPYATRYYWRVDAVNETGTTTGDEWYFDIELSPFLERPPNYNGNLQWQYYNGSYQWVDIDVAGGGRYKQNLVVVGHNCVYYS